MDMYYDRYPNQPVLCTICYCKNSVFKHGCAGAFGEVCLKSWATTKIQSDKLTGQQDIKGLQNGGEKVITFDEMNQKLSKEQFEEITDAYLVNYLTETKDISKGPKPGCNFAGVIKLQACRDSLKGDLCKTEWRDHAQLTMFESVGNSIKNAFKLNPESFNYLNKIVSSNPCPGGGMPIQKLDGCAHMVCQYCKYEFGWLCLQHYPGYVHDSGDICGIRILIRTVLLFTAFMMGICYSIYTNSIASIIVKVTFLFIGKFIVSNLLGISIFLTLIFAFVFADKSRYGGYNCCDKFAYCFLALMVMIYPILWGSSMYYSIGSENFGFITTFLYYEIGTVLVVIAGGISIGLTSLVGYYALYIPTRFLLNKVGKIRGRRHPKPCKTE